jgi:hypothetical protein
MITAPTKYHRVKVHEARLITPVAIPIGSPIIKPNPIIKDGAMAISGLLAREIMTIKESNPKNNNGLITKPVSNTGTGRTKRSATGMIVIKLTASTTNSVAITETAYAGSIMAKHLPIQSSLGLSGVAKRHSILPLTFSLVMGKPEKAQMKEIRINNVRL